MNNQGYLTKLHTIKAKELMFLKKTGMPIPPTLFVNHQFGKDLDIDGIKRYLNCIIAKQYYLRLCFSAS